MYSATPQDHYKAHEELLNIAEMMQAQRRGFEIFIPRRQPDGRPTHTMRHLDSVERWM